MLRNLARFYPAFNRGLSVLRPKPPMSSFAVKTEILCPEEKNHVPGLIIDNEAFDHVTGFYESKTLEEERSRSLGRDVVHQPTVRYTFENVLAAPSGFHVLGGSYSGLGGGYLQAIRQADIPVYDRGFYASSFVTSKFFGHWLRDGLGTQLLHEEGEALYFWHNPTWAHAAEYLKMLGIETVGRDYVFFRQMSFVDDLGMNSNRNARLLQLKEMIRNLRPGVNAGGKVYLKRGTTGVSRVIVNEDEVIAALEPLGFVILDVRQPLTEILDASCGVQMCVTMEGSQAAHTMMASTVGATHITLNPSDRFNTNYVDYMPGLGDRLATLVLRKEGEGYRVDINKLTALIDQLS